jgi:hypothetical protein
MPSPLHALAALVLALLIVVAAGCWAGATMTAVGR